MNETYKENLLQNVRYTAKQINGQVRVSWTGNKRHVSLQAMDGRSCVVWYPLESRVHDIEIADLKEACQSIFNLAPFSI